MNVTVIGGGGYLGNTMVQYMAQTGSFPLITVVDCDMWGDIAPLPSSVVLKQADLLSRPRDGLVSGDVVVWAMDIDCEDFYAMPISVKYIQKNIKVFEFFAKEKKSDLVLVSDDYWGMNESYKEFIHSKEEICLRHGCRMVKVPQLYGPSGRMRYDTLLNEMFYAAFVGGVIHVEDWLRRCPVCSVGTAAEYIVDEIVLGHREPALFCNCCLSVADYAVLMMKIFDGKAQLSFANEKLSMYEYSEYSGKVVPFGRYTIHHSFQYMINSLEKDGINDMVSDCHSNTKMLRSLGAYGSLLSAMQGFLKAEKVNE